LGEQIDALGEDYSLAVNDMEDIAVEIKNTEKRIAEKEVELSTMQGELKQLALKTFTHGGLSSGLSSILGSTSSLSDIVRKKYLTGVALNTGVGNTDALQGVIDDLAKERSTLEKQKKKANDEKIASDIEKMMAPRLPRTGVIIMRMRLRSGLATSSTRISGRRLAGGWRSDSVVKGAIMNAIACEATTWMGQL
jgi:hypothetical protein